MGIIKVNGGSLYQWDTDRSVEITPWKNYTVDEVHFGNPNGATTFVVEPTIENDEVIAHIPNILLQAAINIRVFAVMHTDNGERTVTDCTLGVIARQKPSDYVYTETEVLNYTTLEKRIKELEENGTGGDGKTVMVEFTPTDNDAVLTPSHTSQQIYNFIRNGYQVMAKVDIDAVGVSMIFLPAFANADNVMFVSEFPGDSSDHDVLYSVLSVSGNNALMFDQVTIKEMTGATDQTDGTAGLIPAPVKGQQNRVLFGDAMWKTAYTADQVDALLNKKANKVLVVTATENEDGSITADVNSADIVAYVNGGGESVMKMEDAVLPLIMSEVVSNTAIATYGMTMLAMDGNATPMTVLATVDGTRVTLETFFYDPAEHGFIKADKITESVNYALAQAKESGEFDGEPGQPGTTPHIGANGNWYIGGTDTSVKAKGEPGAKGDPGSDYVLTAEDKTEIAQEAAGLIDTALLSIIGEVSA